MASALTSPETARLFRGDVRVDTFGTDHRGIAYGDGLFETMRAQAARVHWWDRHWARLAHGAERLRLRLPDPVLVEAEAVSLLEGQGDGVLKLIVSRGAGGRGYAPAPSAEPEWQLSLHPLPIAPPNGATVLRWCATRLAQQPLLAGLKHCNRLEQVLARAEWHSAGAVDRDADEGLMLDHDGNVVGATAANVFALRDGRWRTPMLDRCGVAGVCRGWAIPVLDAVEARLSPENVESADAVFLCNAVRGILPVARLGARAWPPSHPRIVQARRLLAAAHPAFAFVPEPS